jgi:hypothetical protein
MSDQVTLNEVLYMAHRLPLADKVRLDASFQRFGQFIPLFLQAHVDWEPLQESGLLVGI